jgi:hypothetical protein
MREPNIEAKYDARETIGDKEIVIAFSEDYDCYVVFFPQIQLGKDPKVYDQLIRLGAHKSEAQDTLSFIRENAQKASSIYDLYKMTKEFLREKRELGQFSQP